jgi:hypothetical protein
MCSGNGSGHLGDYGGLQTGETGGGALATAMLRKTVHYV